MDIKEKSALSDQQFSELIIDIVKRATKDGSDPVDQIEALMVAMISCAAAGDVSPDALFLFTSKVIFAASSSGKIKVKKSETESKDKSKDFDVLFDRTANNPLKN